MYRGCNWRNLYQNLISSFPEKSVVFRSDGCNVMMGENNSVVSRMKKQFPGIVIVKCICHSLHLCASKACKALPRRCEELIQNIVNYFNHSAKRMTNFKHFQQLAEVEIHRLLHPSQTRWLSLHAAVKRIVEQWPALQLYFNSIPVKDRSVSVDLICQDLQNVYLKVLIQFLCWALPKVSDLNLYFQNKKVVITEVDEKMRTTNKDFLLSYLSLIHI